MTITPEQAEIIYKAIDDRLIDLHVSLPGRVQSYDVDTQTAEIELMVTRLLEDEDGILVTEALPVIQNVSVIFTRTKKFFLSLPIEVGDTGDVIFAETSIGQWRATGEVSAPEDVGRCTLSGAKFYPGLVVDGDALDSRVVDLAEGAMLGRIGGARVLIKEDDSVTMKNADGNVTLNSDGSSKAENASGFYELKSSGQFNANDNFTVDP